jgi:C4-dicarboxylate transporter DctM subunit
MIYAAAIAVVVFSLITGNLLATMIAALGFIILWFDFGGNFSVVGNAIWNVVNSFTLSAVPVFILLGEILGATGIAHRIYSALSPTFERLPGKLLQSNIGACTVFSAINGSSMATAAAIGSVAYEELVRRGYDRSAVIGTIAAGGTLGILIPPSLALLIYGSWQNVSVGNLFIGAILPGLMVASFFMLYVAVSAKLRPGAVPAGDAPPSIGRSLLASVHAGPFLILLFAILGTIFFGLATPTESAALGVVTAIILAALYGELTVARLWRALRATVSTFSSLMLVIVGSIILAQAVSLTGIPRSLLQLVRESGLPNEAVLALVYAMYLVLGCVLGGTEMLLITLPITFPLVTGMGYDPVWFGIIVVLLVEIGQITPPVGINLFVMIALSRGKVTLGEAALACVPYWLLLLAAILVITFAPGIVLYLPSLAR